MDMTEDNPFAAFAPTPVPEVVQTTNPPTVSESALAPGNGRRRRAAPAKAASEPAMPVAEPRRRGRPKGYKVHPPQAGKATRAVLAASSPKATRRTAPRPPEHHAANGATKVDIDTLLAVTADMGEPDKQALASLVKAFHTMKPGSRTALIAALGRIFE